MAGGGQEFVGHVGEQAQIAGGMLAEGGQERGGQELGLAGGFEEVGKAILQLLGGMGLQAQPTANAAGDGQQIQFFQTAEQALVAGQDDGEDGAAVEVGAGQQAQFGEDGGVHLLGLVDEQDRPM